MANNQLVVPTTDGFALISCKDILRCEADKSHCRFYLSNGKEIAVKRSLAFFEAKLIEWNFLRVHKSNLVNLLHIKTYLKGERARVVLTDHSEVLVANRKKTTILHHLNGS